MLIKIENDGPEIVSTNYWDLEHAARGFCFLSLNAGTARLLVPKPMEPQIPEMTAGVSLAIITRGEYKGRESLEILFEDGSSSPFALHMSTEQVDRLFSDADRHKEFRLSIWTQGGKQAEFPCRYRKARRLPYLKPWAAPGQC